MTKLEIQKDNKLIAKFMGFDAIHIGYYGSDDETKWQVKNKDWLDKPEIVEQYDHSVGDYYVSIEKNLIIDQSQVNYHKDWSDLMPVVERIELTGCTVTIKHISCRIQTHMGGFDMTSVSLESKIDAVYGIVIQYIKWYNKQLNHISSGKTE